ncbi:MAG: tRNA (adenosine(37)-N6)-threonylcarbamoyltransferase complex ATPase subunit type 1 TsaE [Fimbriimonadaceae bacterium]
MKGTYAADEAATRAIGAEFVRGLRVGEVVFLHGELGAGKTTLVRGMLEELGVRDAVRSPTFNLVQVFDTDPPVMHADLYRVASHAGIGLEDYLETHLCLIEWPERAVGLIETSQARHVVIEFEGPGRRISITKAT